MSSERRKGAPPLWRRPQTRQGAVIAQIYRGQLHWQKWPRKRGRTKNPKLLALQRKFAAAAKLVKYIDDQSKWMIETIARYGPVYPRDLATAAMYGRLFEIIPTNEGEFYSVALRNDISRDLDIVAGTVPGTLLLRAADVWQALVPGAAGLVLTSNGVGALPSYQTAGGAGTTIFTQVGNSNAASGNAFATKGTLIRPRQTFSISRAVGQINQGTSHTWKAGVYRVNSSFVIQEIVGLSAGVTPATGSWQFADFDFNPQPQLDAGTDYFVALSQTTATDTNAAPCARPASAAPWPNIDQATFAFGGSEQRGARIAKANPAVGDTVANSGTLEAWIGLYIQT